VERETVCDRRDDGDAVDLCACILGVDDRDDGVRAVEDHTARGLPVMGIESLALS
jgi:hypothetical protein